jgi:hypothetical protein
MPDAPRPSTADTGTDVDLHESLTELEKTIGLTILATVGVAGIEPTFYQAVRHVRRVALRTVNADQRHPASDGVRLIQRDSRIDVSVDIAVDAEHSALQTARQVRDNLCAAITALGHEPGTIQVTVLTLKT